MKNLSKTLLLLLVVCAGTANATTTYTHKKVYEDLAGTKETEWSKHHEAPYYTDLG